MRVLHIVATARRRGAEVFAGDLVVALNGAGVDQQVVVLDGHGPRGVEFDAPVGYLRGGAHGWRVHPGTIAALRGRAGRWRPDVVQAHGGEPLLHAVLAGVAAPIVYRKIGAVHPRFLRGALRTVYAGMLRRADRVVAVAEAMRREVVDVFGLPGSRVRTIPHAVDSRRVAPTRGREGMRAQLGIPPGAPAIVSLGALTWEKDPLAALSAAAPTLADHPDAVHVFVGDGPMRERLEAQIRARDLQGRVRLLGVRDDVGDLLAACDVLLLSSRIEGLPGCIVEAGMLGVPAAAFAVAGVPEVVADGETGLLAPAGDVARLGDRLRTLIDDPVLRRRLGDAARRRCGSEFEIGDVAPRYLEVYEETAGKAGSAFRRSNGSAHG